MRSANSYEDFVMTGIQIALLLAAMLAGLTGFSVLLIGYRLVQMDNWHFRQTWEPRVNAANGVAFGFAGLLLVFLVAIAMSEGVNPNDASFVLVGFFAGMMAALLVRSLAATRAVRVSLHTIIDIFPEDLPSDQQAPLVGTAHWSLD
jgi:hypothetical protein